MGGWMGGFINILQLVQDKSTKHATLSSTWHALVGLHTWYVQNYLNASSGKEVSKSDV